MKFEELQQQVLDWAEEKDLLYERNKYKQFSKFIEEVFEFKREIDNFSEIPTSVNYEHLNLELGDVFVTLIILAFQLGTTPTKALENAYNKIKDRKGQTVDGTFIKQEDLES